MTWNQGFAEKIEHTEDGSTVTTQSGEQFSAKLIIDATGHKPAFIQRPVKDNVAYQAAYGMVIQCSKPPIQPGRCILMDYRDGHLTDEDRSKPPTFLYAMDLGNDIYFLEETSLAYNPAISLKRSRIGSIDASRQTRSKFWKSIMKSIAYFQ